MPHLAENIFLGKTNAFSVSSWRTEQLEVYFKGWLFNPEEFCSKSQSFSGNPAELIAGLWKREKDLPLAKFNGDFAVLLLDRRQNQIYAARDIHGSINLYYSETKKQFAFDLEALASEASELDNKHLGEYLLGQLRSHGSTAFKDIKRVKAGSCLTWSNSGLSSEHFWQPPRIERELLQIEEAKELLLSQFEKAICKRLRLNKGAALSLSGGLDSASIYTFIQARFEDYFLKLKPFTSTFSAHSCDESERVRSLIEQIAGGELGEYVKAELDPSGYLEREIRNYCDLPNYPSGLYGDQLKQKIAASGTTAMFTGYGADELFTVSSPSFATSLRNSLAPFLPSHLKQILKNSGLVADWIPPWFTEKFRKETEIEIMLQQQPFYPIELEASKQRCYRYLFEPWTVRMRELEGRAVTKYGLISLNPFLDINFVEACFKIPSLNFHVNKSNKSLLLNSVGQYLPKSYSAQPSKADFSSVLNQILYKLADKGFQSDLALYQLGWVERDKLKECYSEFRCGKGKYSFWEFWPIIAGETFIKSYL